jgi:hypothetical protein
MSSRLDGRSAHHERQQHTHKSACGQSDAGVINSRTRPHPAACPSGGSSESAPAVGPEAVRAAAGLDGAGDRAGAGLRSVPRAAPMCAPTKQDARHPRGFPAWKRLDASNVVVATGGDAPHQFAGIWVTWDGHQPPYRTTVDLPMGLTPHPKITYGSMQTVSLFTVGTDDVSTHRSHHRQVCAKPTSPVRLRCSRAACAAALSDAAGRWCVRARLPQHVH